MRGARTPLEKPDTWGRLPALGYWMKRVTMPRCIRVLDDVLVVLRIRQLYEHRAQLGRTIVSNKRHIYACSFDQRAAVNVA